MGYLSESTELYLACSAGPQVVVSPATISSCQQVTVEATGFLPNSTADVSLEANGNSIALGRLSIAASSKGSATFSVPASFPLGPATALTSGTNMVGKAVSPPQASPVTVTACGVSPSSTSYTPTSYSGTTTSGSLPRTGSDSGRLIGIGAGLIVLGGAAVYGSLRSRRSAQTS